MPMYEYVCDEDGDTITLLRPMGEADAPVEDPRGKGRRFTRVCSTFEVGGAARPKPGATPGSGCACGNPHGPCGH